MAEGWPPESSNRTGWVQADARFGFEDERERTAEIREQWLIIAAAVVIGVLNILIVAVAVWHPTSTFELMPMLPE